MDKPLQAHSWNEAGYYLLVTHCPSCGKGPLRAAARKAGENAAALQTRCTQCGTAGTLAVECAAGEGPPAELFAGFFTEHVDGAFAAAPVNPTDQPSRIIDVGQWLSLFHLLIESASKTDDRAACRRMGYQAAQCLSEALKFYADDELPPEQAIFCESTRMAFHDHPETFARQRLRDLQAKLPALGAMARRVAQDERPAGPQASWWKFWRRRG